MSVVLLKALFLKSISIISTFFNLTYEKEKVYWKKEKELVAFESIFKLRFTSRLLDDSIKF